MPAQRRCGRRIPSTCSTPTQHAIHQKKKHCCPHSTIKKQRFRAFALTSMYCSERLTYNCQSNRTDVELTGSTSASSTICKRICMRVREREKASVHCVYKIGVAVCASAICIEPHFPVGAPKNKTSEILFIFAYIFAPGIPCLLPLDDWICIFLCHSLARALRAQHTNIGPILCARPISRNNIIQIHSLNGGDGDMAER